VYLSRTRGLCSCSKSPDKADIGGGLKKGRCCFEIIVQTWRSARKSIKGVTESEVPNALQAFDPLWNQLFPTEQARIIELLVERVDVRADCVDIKLRIAGVTSLISELTGNATTRREAA
jgi:site-specific DNA recombinase